MFKKLVSKSMESDWHQVRKKWQELCCRAKAYKNRTDGKSDRCLVNEPKNLGKSQKRNSKNRES